MSLPQHYQLIQLDSIDSTNLEAKRLIQGGKMSDRNLVISAKSQSGGRGRLDRKWVSEEGNLFVSVVKGGGKKEKGKELNIGSSSLHSLSLLPFLTALAIGDTLRKFIKEKPLYKWPNDVLVADKKISGVLIEVIAGYVIIGVGINITNYPKDGTKFPATCLNEHTEKQSALADVLEALIHNMDKWLGAKNTDIINEWMVCAYGMGKNIAIMQEKREISGIFSGIDANGGLILEMDRGKRETVLFGDVRWV